MKPVDGIIGPGMTENDVSLAMPECVKIETPEDADEVKQLLHTLVAATNRNAARVLRSMLGPGTGAEQLCAEFGSRLGIT